MTDTQYTLLRFKEGLNKDLPQANSNNNGTIYFAKKGIIPIQYVNIDDFQNDPGTKYTNQTCEQEATLADFDVDATYYKNSEEGYLYGLFDGKYYSITSRFLDDTELQRKLIVNGDTSLLSATTIGTPDMNADLTTYGYSVFNGDVVLGVQRGGNDLLIQSDTTQFGELESPVSNINAYAAGINAKAENITFDSSSLFRATAPNMTLGSIYGQGENATPSYVDILGNVDVSHNMLIKGELEVEQGTILDGTLDVGEEVVFNNTLNVSGATTLENTLTVNGASALEDTLTVGGSAILQDALHVTGATTLNNSLAVAGVTVLSDTLTVGGDTTLNNALIVVGDTTLSDTLTVTKETILNDTLTVAKETTLNDTLTVTKGTTLNDTLTVAKATTLNDALTVVKAATFKDTLTVDESTTLNDTLTVTGATTLNNSLAVAKVTVLSDTLTVAKATTLNDTLTVAKTTTIGTTSSEADLIVNGDVHITGSDLYLGSGTTAATRVQITYSGTDSGDTLTITFND